MSGEGGRKRSHEASFKLKVVEYAEKESNRAAGRKYGVNEKQVREWRKKKQQLIALPPKKKRLEGGGKKPLIPEIEEKLEEWIEHLRAGNLRVTRISIQRKAMEIFQSSDRSHDFTASRGWLENFLKRKTFTLRRRTTVSQRLPPDLVPRVVCFVLTTRKLFRKNSYALSAIGNMDETPLWLDMPGETTISRVGERSGTGHEILQGVWHHSKSRWFRGQ